MGVKITIGGGGDVMIRIHGGELDYGKYYEPEWYRERNMIPTRDKNYPTYFVDRYGREDLKPREIAQLIKLMRAIVKGEVLRKLQDREAVYQAHILPHLYSSEALFNFYDDEYRVWLHMLQDMEAFEMKRTGTIVGKGEPSRTLYRINFTSKTKLLATYNDADLELWLRTRFEVLRARSTLI